MPGGWVAVLAMGVALAVAGPVAMAGGAQQLAQADAPPREHFKVLRPANLNPAEAEAIHRAMGRRMADRYAVSRHPVAERYITWRRQNASPYRSASPFMGRPPTLGDVWPRSPWRFAVAGRRFWSWGVRVWSL